MYSRMAAKYPKEMAWRIEGGGEKGGPAELRFFVGTERVIVGWTTGNAKGTHRELNYELLQNARATHELHGLKLLGWPLRGVSWGAVPT